MRLGLAALVCATISAPACSGSDVSGAEPTMLDTEAPPGDLELERSPPEREADIVALDVASEADAALEELSIDGEAALEVIDAEDIGEAGPEEVLEPECEPDTFCLGGVAGICSTSGQWQPSEDCGAQGLLCVTGSCRSACDVEADDEGLAGCDHWAVGLAHRGEGPFAIAVYNPSSTLVANVAVWRRTSGEVDAEVIASMAIDPGDSRTFALPPADVSAPGRSWSGLRVRSTSPIIATQHSPLAAMSASSGDGSLLLPAQGMGSEFIAVGRPESRTLNSERTRGSLSIVAASAGTQVTLIPSEDIDAGPLLGQLGAGQQTLVPLQPHEVLHLTTAFEGGSLAGTRLYTSQPVALFAAHEADRGATLVSVDAEGDHLEDALRPVSRWGKLHVAAKSVGAGGLSDALLIVAAEDDTLIQFKPPIMADFQMEGAQQRRVSLSEDTLVLSSRPVQIVQLTAGAEALADPPIGTTCVLDVQCALGYACEDFACALPLCEGALDTSCPSGHRCACDKDDCRCDPVGDAAWWVLPPAEQYETEMTFIAPPTYPIHQVSLTLAPGTEAVTLNGELIEASPQALDDSGYRVVSLSVPSGPHTLKGDGPIGVVVYGFGQDSGYGHAGGQALRDLQNPLCSADSDCPAPLSTCFGVPFCDTTQVPARCNLIAESSVNCAASQNPCVFSVCDPEGGASCTQVMAPEGVSCASDAFPCALGVCSQGECVDPVDPCDDGLFCNGAEFCDAETETCQMGTPPSIDDGIACSLDACDEGLKKVTHVPIPGVCDDGFVCNGAEVCDLIKGCIHQSLSICDDGVFCNGVEGCDDVVCIPGQAPVIDDGIACTLDACNEAIGALVHLPDPSLCVDDDPCTIDQCDPELGCVHTPDLCDDANACTIDACDPNLGCVHQAFDCDDKDACTSEFCDSELGCVYEEVVCIDEDVCTEDFCVTSFGCVFGDPCDDGNACTTDGCITPGDCTYSDLVCEDNDPCTLDSCDVNLGCLHQNLCDDFNACTIDDCSTATCVYTEVNCDDEDPCTSDSCSPLSGCVNLPLDCGDGDPCTEDLCNESGACQNPVIDCSDDNPCTKDLCDTQGDCIYPLDDCDDGIACTVDICHSVNGCENNSPCDDGLTCTEDICLPGGGCDWQTLDCDDGDPCTEDACDNVSGCMHTPICGGE